MTRTIQIAVAVSVGIFAMGLHTARAATRTYPTGSLIVPMDTTYQDSGMLRAYGLVYKLLSNGVPIDWIIKPGKTHSQSDVTIDFRNITTMATGTHAYRGGPFVIDVANRAVALPIIQAWQSVNPNTVAHEATAAFTADVGRSLVAAPRMAVLADGNELIAFGYLNAAGIPDSRGVTWPGGGVAPYPGYVDILFPSEVAGPTTTNHRDGLLFDANGTPRFSLLMTMHWQASTGTQDEAIAEIKEFLKSRNLVFAECQAATTLENKGLLLTDLGLTVQARPTGVNHFFNNHPLAQADGVFGTVGGSDPAFLPAGVYLGTEGTEYHRLLRGTTTGVDVLEAGYAFQNTAAGRVVYLGGHQYSTNLPISVNPTTNGVRHFLNALLFAPATALGDGAADLSATLSGPASPTTNPDMDFSITYRNAGLGAALDTQVVVPIPAGTTASMVSGGGSVSGGQIVWTLGNLADGQPSPSGTLSFRLTAASSGTFTVTATASYKRGITPVSTVSTAYVTYKFATTTALSSSANPSVQGQPVTFTATVTSSSGAPTGTVTFKDGSTTLGMAGLSGASPYQAMFTTSTLTAGTHGITAMYGGDANFNQSTSPLLSQDVTASFGYAKGDFTGDGKPDILWRNMSTGENLLWTMDGFAQTAVSSYPTVTDLNWKIQAVGDYNADLKSDLVWRNSVTGQNVTWFMDGSTMLSFGYPPDISDTNWNIQASGDLNRDGQFDLLWRNAANGLNVWWYMSGANLVQWGFLPDIADLNWNMYGSGDLDGDTKWDLVWRNSSNGLNVVWMLNGNAFDRWAFLPDIVDANWRIQAVADYNRDGKADLIWRNMATGQNVYWIMNGPSLVSYGFLPTVPDLNWQIVGPR